MEGSGTGTTHGIWAPYDAHIPLLFYGWGIKKGHTNKETYILPFGRRGGPLQECLAPSRLRRLERSSHRRPALRGVALFPKGRQRNGERCCGDGGRVSLRDALSLDGRRSGRHGGRARAGQRRERGAVVVAGGGKGEAERSGENVN